MSRTTIDDLLVATAAPVSATDVSTIVHWAEVGDDPEIIAKLVDGVRHSHRLVIGVGWPGPAGERLLDAATLTLVSDGPDDPRTVRVGSVTDALADLESAAAATPIAAATFSGLMRMAERLSVHDGLIAESLAYSTLQAGPEYARWLAAADYRTPPGEESPIRTFRNGSTLGIELDRPRRHNALNAAMRDALVESLTVAVIDDSIDTLELSGRGASFSSGGDLAEFGTTSDPATAHLIRTQHRPGELIHTLAVRLGKRCRARVHGAVMGGGLELAAFAGHITAARDSKFLLPELSMGLVPGAGGTVSVSRRIGRHRTAWMVLTGDVLDADRAVEWGLVDALED